MKRLIVTTFVALCFSQTVAAYDDTDNVTCLALNGQVAVGQVTLNRVNDSRFPNNICEVVMQGPHKKSWKDKTKMIPVRNLCQFSWYCDGKSDTIRDIETYREIYRLAIVLIAEWSIDITNGATHYHAYYVTPAWAKTKTRTAKIEDHIFYRWEK
jgi:spore germination cell wall hydrolase CwlJ-like protein